MNERHVRAYLERLGIHQEPDGSVKMLSDLVRAQLTHVPFENLWVYDAEKIPSLKPEDLYYKIVTRNGGGYCFELNTLFCDLLNSLGYPAERRAARILRPGRPIPPALHMSVIAEAEGRRFLCDVGFGGPGPKDIVEVSEGEREVRGRKFRLSFREHDVVRIEQMKDGEYIPLMDVNDRFIEPADFEIMNYYCASAPGLFSSHRIVQIETDTGSRSLTDDTLTVRENGKEETRTAKDDRDLCDILAEEFSLSAPDMEELDRDASLRSRYVRS